MSKLSIRRFFSMKLSASGTVLEPKEVMTSVANPTLGLEPLEMVGQRVGEGVWRVENLPETTWATSSD